PVVSVPYRAAPTLGPIGRDMRKIRTMRLRPSPLRKLAAVHRGIRRRIIARRAAHVEARIRIGTLVRREAPEPILSPTWLRGPLVHSRDRRARTASPEVPPRSGMRESPVIGIVPWVELDFVVPGPRPVR